MRILIAADEPDARILLRAGLESLGHEVCEAPDGLRAWEFYRKSEIRMLIIDWMMPGLDGPELCERIRAKNRTPYTYILMLTSLEGRGRYLEAMRAGADDFINKPPDLEELQARLAVAERILGLPAEVKTLESLLPICSYCKMIRDKEENWHDVSEYIADRTDTEFSHGICPDCFRQHAGPMLDEVERAGLGGP
jgi:DNA-binding response OmpR family regulator